MYTSGYARKSRQSGLWQYSSECLALLIAYKEVIEHILYARMQYTQNVYAVGFVAVLVRESCTSCRLQRGDRTCSLRVHAICIQVGYAHTSKLFPNRVYHIEHVLYTQACDVVRGSTRPSVLLFSSPTKW